MDKKFCKFCGEEIDKNSVVCPKCGRQLQVVKKEEPKKEVENKTDDKPKFYEQVWFMWVMLIFFAPVGIFLMWKFHDEMKKNTKIILTVVFAIFFLIVAVGGNSDETTTDNGSSSNTGSSNTSSEVSKKKVEVIDFSSMQEHEILTWCKENNLNCSMKREYSDSIAKDGFIKQSVNATQQVAENTKIVITYSLGKAPTTEQKNALKKAESYAKTLHMSKAKIYDQLTSEYGEGFDKDAAQYAIDNIEWDWNANALAKAKSYRDTMSMSKNRIYDQLISEYGEKFTKEQAQYAVDHLDD